MSFKVLTQGGQVTLHNIRMFRQVFTVTLLITILSGLVFWGVKTWYDFTPYQRYVIGSAWLADIKLSVSGDKDRETQMFHYTNGKQEVIQSISIKNNKRIQFWVKAFEDQAWHNMYLSFWFMGGLFLLICVFWIWRGNVRKAKEILSGSKIVESASLQKLLKNQHIDSPLTIGEVSLRLNTETQHIMVCGTTGTGKSTCFYHLLPQIREHKQRAVIVDTTGEFVSRFYRKGKDILINPFDKRSVGWNPWVDCHTPYHYDELASAFIPESNNENKFWSDSARTVLAEALKLFSRKNTESIDDLLNLLLESSLKDLFVALKNTPAASLVDPAGDRTAMSIRSHLNPLKNLRYLSSDKPAFSVRDWVQKKKRSSKSDPQWLFIACAPDQRETLKPLMSGLFTTAINSLLSTPPDPTNRLWFIIDELPSLHKQESFLKALAEIRKPGGCIAVGIQNIPQIQALYGYAETKSLTSLFNTKVIFRNGDPESAKHMSQMLGEQEVKEVVEGISFGEHSMRDGVSLNEQKHHKPVVTPNDIMTLDGLEAYLKLPGNLPITKIKFEIPSSLPRCPAFVPIPRHRSPKTRISKARVLETPTGETHITEEVDHPTRESLSKMIVKSPKKQSSAEDPS